jgi:hypothetical protein
MIALVLGVLAVALLANVLFVKFVAGHAPIIPDGFGE